MFCKAWLMDVGLPQLFWHKLQSYHHILSFYLYLSTQDPFDNSTYVMKGYPV